MDTYTAWEYLLIDTASHYGLDKELFPTRIQWTLEHLQELESLMDDADDPYRYIKAVKAIRAVQRGEAIGHRVGLDASSSGPQIMSAMMGCETGAESTGLVDPNRRADLYTDTTAVMSRILGGLVNVSRKDVKDAQMPHYYGSRKRPKELFGEDTPELAAFYKANWEVLPGASKLRNYLLQAWDRDAEVHEWTLPDGFHARVKVMYHQDKKIEVDELNHATFTHRFHRNLSTNDHEQEVQEPVEDGLSLAANVVHAVDGMVVREMNRRCNYDRDQLLSARDACTALLDPVKIPIGKPEGFVALGLIEAPIEDLALEEVQALRDLIDRVLEHKPFPILCIHDEFSAHAGNMNQVRYWYKEILAELADSNIVEFLLGQLYEGPVNIKKSNPNLGDLIRKSNYALV